MRTLLLLALGLALASAARDLTGYKVFKTGPLTEVQYHAVYKLDYDFWKRPLVGGEAHMMVPPEKVRAIELLFKHYNIDYEVILDDIENFFAEDRARVAAARAASTGGTRQDDFDFGVYHTYDEFQAYLSSVADSVEQATLVDIGPTYEGRTMWALQIANAGDNKVADIYFQANIHAREWIAGAVGLYTINKVLEDLAAGGVYTSNFNWYMVPMANPDGYEYTWSSERLWRKTRSDQSQSRGCGLTQGCSGDECIGVDPNRNWDEHWGYSGVSQSACDLDYPGEFAFSEVETQNLRDYWLDLPSTPAVSLCFHSAAELWLYPYGWDYNQFPENVDEIREVGQAAVDALNAVNGERFEFINSAQLYPASGASDDWFTTAGGRFVNTPELREGAPSVFILPEEEIIPSGEEVWAAWRVYLDNLLQEAGR